MLLVGCFYEWKFLYSEDTSREGGYNNNLNLSRTVMSLFNPIDAIQWIRAGCCIFYLVKLMLQLQNAAIANGFKLLLVA